MTIPFDGDWRLESIVAQEKANSPVDAPAVFDDGGMADSEAPGRFADATAAEQQREHLRLPPGQLWLDLGDHTIPQSPGRPLHRDIGFAPGMPAPGCDRAVGRDRVGRRVERDGLIVRHESGASLELADFEIPGISLPRYLRAYPGQVGAHFLEKLLLPPRVTGQPARHLA